MQASRRLVKTHQGPGPISSSFSNGFQIYLCKCCDHESRLYDQRIFFWVSLPSFSILILSLPLLGLDSQSTSLTHFLDCLKCTRNAMPIAVLLQMKRGYGIGEGWLIYIRIWVGVQGWTLLYSVCFFSSAFVFRSLTLSVPLSVPLFFLLFFV